MAEPACDPVSLVLVVVLTSIPGRSAPQTRYAACHVPAPTMPGSGDDRLKGIRCLVSSLCGFEKEDPGLGAGSTPTFDYPVLQRNTEFMEQASPNSST